MTSSRLKLMEKANLWEHDLFAISVISHTFRYLLSTESIDSFCGKVEFHFIWCSIKNTSARCATHQGGLIISQRPPIKPLYFWFYFANILIYIALCIVVYERPEHRPPTHRVQSLSLSCANQPSRPSYKSTLPSAMTNLLKVMLAFLIKNMPNPHHTQRPHRYRQLIKHWNGALF